MSELTGVPPATIYKLCGRGVLTLGKPHKDSHLHGQMVITGGHLSVLKQSNAAHRKHTAMSAFQAAQEAGK